jgi:hypothetical protein
VKKPAALLFGLSSFPENMMNVKESVYEDEFLKGVEVDEWLETTE